MYSLKTLLCITRTQPEKNLDDEVHISIYTDPNMNYALNKPTTSSTFVHLSHRTVDGNSNTNWWANGCFETEIGNTDIQWWRVDFQEEIQVARVVITNRGNINYRTCIRIRVVLIFAKFARFNFAHLVETYSRSFKFAQVIFRIFVIMSFFLTNTSIFVRTYSKSN